MSLKNPVTPPGIDPGTVRLVPQRLNHYATTGPTSSITRFKIQKFYVLPTQEYLCVLCGNQNER